MSILGLTIEKKTTHLPETLPPAESLAMTLRFLATGDSQASMSYAYRVGRSTVSTIIAEVSDAIWNVLKDKYVHFPSHETECEAISNEFDEIWNFPQCLGAIDGKCVRIVVPRSSGTLYHNYKGFFSIILLAIYC